MPGANLHRLLFQLFLQYRTQLVFVSKYKQPLLKTQPDEKNFNPILHPFYAYCWMPEKRIQHN